MKKEDIAVLVLTCDKYADIWKPFYNFFFKYWPDCPYRIYHGSNNLTFDHPRVTSLYSRQNTDWSTETKEILKQIQEKYVIIILEDYFIYKKIDNQEIARAMDVMEETDGLFLKLCCFPSSHNSRWKYEKLKEHPFIGRVLPDQEYRVNLQIGAWNRELLLNLIKDGESPWEFETIASKRSNQVPHPCLCIVEDPEKDYVHGPFTYLCTALSKGVWMRDAITLCKKENILVSTASRKVETRFEYLYRIIYTRTPLSKRKYLEFIKRKFFNFQYIL